MNCGEQLNICKLCVIVNFGQGSRVVQIACEQGGKGGIILLGRGTYHHTMMELLGLNERRKEIVWMITTQSKAEALMNVLEKTLKLQQNNTGISYIEPLLQVYHKDRPHYTNDLEGEEHLLQAIYTVVDAGKGHLVVEAASDAGANGGTIFEGRGAGAHQTTKVFSIEIEPEKDIVLTIVSVEKVDAIMESIKSKLNIELEGKGIIFVHPISKSAGINRL